ncbi:hypothetical protein C0W92_20150 [Photobacterium angustum]|uniref:Uncharacterized protein n=2 Tax=Photobacterium angustum TaxID=661 RepID=A0A855S722_PHOAN|nr:hypothetical protein UB36_19240 [Photobacterium damselae subsp. damselae]KJG27863.1 hypothetical protein UA69_18420 [Photobacterium angustum]KJG37573.1 hypothetical protein UA35_16995 [Photobacterium angustum]KJG43519.1 hypothetical protein UA31_19245 [Photobacterium angustum]KJG45629.1 hypothetical protein UA30_19365 [Photobacterium angustum]
MNYRSPRKNLQKLYFIFIVLFQLLTLESKGVANATEFERKKAVIFVFSCTGWFGEVILMSNRAGKDGI